MDDTASLPLGSIELDRVCRDLAHAELAAMPALRHTLPPRLAPAAALDWGRQGLAADSLAAMQLATAAATWCNAYDAGFEDLFLAKRNAADWAQAMLRARAAGARHVTFASSGSTGARKHVRHREANLWEEASAWRDLLNDRTKALPVPARVINLVPTHHIYGFLWGVLVPLALNVPALDAEAAALPALQAGDLIVAVPEQWAWIAASARPWPEGAQGVSSTAPLADEVAAVLAPGKLVRLLQIYGASETGGLGWRAEPGVPYRLRAGRARTTADGIGAVVVSSTGLATAEAVGLDVPDHLNWADDHHFRLQGRRDASVQVGGHNVAPAWVEAQLRRHPQVADVAVRLDTAATPPRLKAFVVLKEDNASGSDVMRVAFEAWLREQLPWYAQPGRLRYGPELPRNSMGKASDWSDVD
jgi:long-chain acyl-CoA synthetase